MATLLLGTGRTTVLQVAVHLMSFAIYLFVAIVAEERSSNLRSP